MPWCVLRELPLIPDELQFRFVEHDLVLIDIDASLVVDVLPNALPARGSWKGLHFAHARDGNRRRRCCRNDNQVAHVAGPGLWPRSPLASARARALLRPR